MEDLNAASNDLRLSGIGGWLGLLAIGVVLSPIVILMQSINLYIQIINDNLLPQLFDVNIGLFSVIIFEILAGVFLFVFSIVLCVLLFKKSKKFPTRMTIYMITNILITTIDYALIYQFANSAENSQPLDLTRTVLFALVWGIYLRRSRRVNNTFVN